MMTVAVVLKPVVVIAVTADDNDDDGDNHDDDYDGWSSRRFLVKLVNFAPIMS